MTIEEEYESWDPDAREAYDERIAILSDGGKITAAMVEIARREARLVNVDRIMERVAAGASGGSAIRMCNGYGKA